MFFKTIKIVYAVTNLHHFKGILIFSGVGVMEEGKGKESSTNNWQKQISSGFDSLISFASSELDRSKEIRRKSMEVDNKSSGPPRITPSSIALHEKLPGSPSTEKDDKVPTSMPTLSPVDVRPAEAPKESRSKGKGTKSPQHSSPQHKGTRSRSSSSESKSKKDSKDSANHLSIKNSSKSRSRSPSPRSKDSDDKYSKYDKHFKKKFFGRDYNFKKDNAHPKSGSEGVYGKFKHVKGKDWEKSQSSELDSLQASNSSKSSEVSSTPPPGEGSSHSSHGAKSSSRPNSNSSTYNGQLPNGTASGQKDDRPPSRHRGSPADSARHQKMGSYMDPSGMPQSTSSLPLSLSSTHPSFSLAHAGLRGPNPSPPTLGRPHGAMAQNAGLIPELSRPEMLAGGPFGRPSHLGDNPRGLPGSRIPPHLAGIMQDSMHNGPRFDVRGMPMFSDLTAPGRPGFLGNPGFRPGLGDLGNPRPPGLLEMNRSQLDMLQRSTFPDMLGGPPRLFPINSSAKDKGWKS